ncbi:60S ribosomal protein L5 [Onygenales sp. PD_10]|nr:60S ribosomal protein L5 [Onygenales sp. PD_10]
MPIILHLLLSAEIISDKVFTYIYAYKLKCYSIEYGLTNWAAAYTASLLFSLNENFTDIEELKGEYILTEAAETDDDSYYPFKGTFNSSIFISYSKNYFPNYNIKIKKLNIETLCKYIFSSHITDNLKAICEDLFKKEESTELKKIKAE